MTEISRLPGPVMDLWEWQYEGKCREADPTLFFHPEGERGAARRRRAEAAKAVCAELPRDRAVPRALPRGPRALRRVGRALRGGARRPAQPARCARPADPPHLPGPPRPDGRVARASPTRRPQPPPTTKPRGRLTTGRGFVVLVSRTLSADDGEDVARGEDQELLAGVLDLGAAVLAVDDLVADGDVERHALALVVDRPGPTARTSPSWGFSFAVSGMTRPDAVVCSASSVRTTTRSSSGLMETDTADLPFTVVGTDVHRAAGAVARRRGCRSSPDRVRLVAPRGRQGRIYAAVSTRSTRVPTPPARCRRSVRGSTRVDAAALSLLLSPDGWALLGALPPLRRAAGAWSCRSGCAVRASTRAWSPPPSPSPGCGRAAPSKFDDFADGMLFTQPGLEQATRLTVARPARAAVPGGGLHARRRPHVRHRRRRHGVGRPRARRGRGRRPTSSPRRSRP